MLDAQHAGAERARERVLLAGPRAGASRVRSGAVVGQHHGGEAVAHVPVVLARGEARIHSRRRHGDGQPKKGESRDTSRLRALSRFMAIPLDDARRFDALGRTLLSSGEFRLTGNPLEREKVTGFD